MKKYGQLQQGPEKGLFMDKGLIESYEKQLREAEKSNSTVEKYLRDLYRFNEYLNGGEVTKQSVIGWKHDLMARGYKPASINSMLAALNSFLLYIGRSEMVAKNIRLQKRSYRSEYDELTKEEYFRLLNAAASDLRLQLMMQTICSTGIRVSELNYFTVEAAEAGEVTIACKGKMRTILIPNRLREKLLAYSELHGISSGAIFLTRKGSPVNRSNIWSGMKSLCAAADVLPSKVYPHNLRKLFAREFYLQDKDLAKLADVLGHSNIETTRIYIMGTGREHREQIERMDLML